MHADAFGRARKLLSSSSPNARVKAGVLGVVHSLLMLSLLGIAGLLAGLIVTRGETRFPTERLASLPGWMSQPREVTDIRDAMFRALDLSPRMLVLGAGLLALALFISPLLTLFLLSLGGLVWMTTRVMLRDAQRISDAAMRDAAVQLCLLHEDLG